MSIPQVRADIDRIARTGEPEIVYAAGKTPAQTVMAVSALVDADVRPVIVSRADQEHADAVLAAHPSAVHHLDARMVVLGALERVRMAAHEGTSRAPDRAPNGHTNSPGNGRTSGDIVIATAGTSDLSVAQECARTLDALGERPTVLLDIGVAGLHRVLAVRDTLEAARVLIIVAGMEAALGPVVAGLVRAPVIAVPTSVGYGAAQEGMTALHGLLASCAPGIAVVNIDNGLGAALLARRILRAGDPR
jgi:pyridinium-3,5-biscarboxylic acid mononucleotide synthase